MAELGRREIVSDPLALNPREQGADRSLPTYGVRNPGQGAGDEATKGALNSLNILDGITAAVGRVMEQRQEEANINGQLARVQGVTEAEIIKSGNKASVRGWHAMDSATNAQTWFTNEAQFIETEGAAMDPDSYRKRLMEEQARQIDRLPNDPAVRKTWLASFKDAAPRLMSEQVVKHNEYNTNQAMVAGEDLLYKSATTQPDASVSVMNGTFRVNMEPVEEPLEVSENDRDIGIRTMIAEAGGEGPEGMAAVAHVMINRVRDKRYPKTIQEVALADKQFSVWNDGGSVPLSYDTTSAIYKRASKVFDATVGGLHVDPTAGAVNYFSAKGMKDLKDKGAQANLIPPWWNAAVAESGGSVIIGNHEFAGKSTGYTPAQQAIQTATGEAVLEPMPTADGTVDTEVDNPATEVPTEKGGARIQRILKSMPLRGDQKAEVLGRAIVRALDNGDDTLFNDAGGIATLQGLNAPFEVMDKVRKAKDRFDTEKDKNFDVTYEKGRAELLARVQTDSFATLEDALNAVDEFHTNSGGSDAEAKSLARSVASEWSKADRTSIVPLELRNLGATLYDGIASGRITAEQASQQIIDSGKTLNVKPSVIENFVASMYSKAQSQKEQDRTKADAEFKKVQAEKVIIAQAQNALARDSGLKGLTGQVRIPDPNIPGATKTVSGEEYGVWALKNDTLNNYMKQYSNDIKSGNIDSLEVSSMAARDVYEKLAKQQVYDKEAGREIASAVIGNLMTEDGKQVRPEASQALDFYMQSRNNPNIGTEYLDGMIESSEAKSLLESAAQMYDGQMDLNAALLKASQRLTAPMDAQAQLNYNTIFASESQKAIQGTIQSLGGRNSFFNQMGLQPYEMEEVMKYPEVPTAYIEQKAKIFHAQNPREPVGVSTKRAADDLARNSVIVAGQFITGNSERNERLDQVMGLEDLGKRAPNEAIKEYLADFGEKKWGDLWTKGLQGKTGVFDPSASTTGIFYGGSNPSGRFGPLGAGTNPASYTVSYNPAQRAVEIQLYGNAERTTFVGRPMIVPVKEIGEHYKNKAKVGGTNALKELWRDFKEEYSDRLHYESVPRPNLGADLGRLANESPVLPKTDRNPK